MSHMKERSSSSTQAPSSSATDSALPPGKPRVHRQWLRIGQAIWLVGMAIALWDTAATVRLLSDPGIVFLYDGAEFVKRLGLSPVVYARSILTLFLIVALSYLAIAVLIIWRRRQNWFALLVSLMLILIEARVVVGLSTANIEQTSSTMSAVQVIVTLFSLALPVLVFYLFPDGRFVPRWTGLLAGAWLVWTGVVCVAGPGTVAEWFGYPWIAWPWLVAYGSGIVAQISRYRRMSTALQRQQTKWVMLGLSIPAVVLILVFLLLSGVELLVGLPQEASKPTPVVLFFEVLLGSGMLVGLLLVPVTLAIALLRYRLWDVDIIVNRALVYGALTTTLAFVYFGSVVLLQQVVRRLTGQTSSLVIVASTLAIAALFQPLRRHIQGLIDRHFYRRKYNTARTLQSFSITLRDEVDLSRLTDDLLAVVEETMQPAHVELWIRDAPKQGR